MHILNHITKSIGIDVNQKADNRLHTIQMNYQKGKTKPVCKYYYGEDQPTDWPIEMHDGIKLTKATEAKPSRNLLQRLFACF